MKSLLWMSYLIVLLGSLGIEAGTYSYSRHAAQLSDLASFYQNELRPILKERVSGTQGNIDVQDHLKLRMKRLGWTVTEDRFEDKTPYGVKNFNNIIATLDPSVRRKLVISAHFDSKQMTNFVAATDSAVPCAMMLDLANSLNSTLWHWANSKAEDVTLQFMFFDGEEAFQHWTSTDSLYGSRHLVEQLGDQIHDIDLFILLDLLGAKDPRFPNFFHQTDHVYKHFQAIEYELEEFLHPHRPYFSASSIGGSIEDDHKPFLNKGVPILHLIPSPFPPQWHKTSDTEENLDWATIDNLNALLRVFVTRHLGIY